MIDDNSRWKVGKEFMSHSENQLIRGVQHKILKFIIKNRESLSFPMW